MILSIKSPRMMELNTMGMPKVQEEAVVAVEGVEAEVEERGEVVVVEEGEVLEETKEEGGVEEVIKSFLVHRIPVRIPVIREHYQHLTEIIQIWNFKFILTKMLLTIRLYFL
jgi:hypothetical protein